MPWRCPRRSCRSGPWTAPASGVGDFKQPNDLYVTRDGIVYILDSGNNRIIVLDDDWNVIRIIDGF